MSAAPRIAAAAVIRNATGAILMIQREPNAAIGGGEWAIPGGKVDPGESLEDCVVREIAEEIGIRIESCRRIDVVTEDRAWGPENAFDTHYFAVDAWSGTPRIMEPHKHVAMRWIDEDRLRSAADGSDPDLALFEPMTSLIRKGGLRPAHDGRGSVTVEDEAERRRATWPDWHAVVSQMLRRPASCVLALHVPEEERGAGLGFKRAAEAMGIDVRDLNNAYHGGDVRRALAERVGLETTLPEAFGGDGVRILYLTGWGSDPRAADHMLKAVHAHVARNPNLRLVAMNNASPIPPMFRSSGPTAHPNGEGFRCHVAETLRIDGSSVVLVDVGAASVAVTEAIEEDEPFTEGEMAFIVGRDRRSPEAHRARLVDLITSIGSEAERSGKSRTKGEVG